MSTRECLRILVYMVTILNIILSLYSRYLENYVLDVLHISYLVPSPTPPW